MREVLKFTTSTPILGDLWIDVEFIVPPPKTVKRSSPRGDIDNFVKGPLDSMTKHGGFWNDDDQIVHLDATKRYQKKDEKYGIKIRYGSCSDTPEL